MPDMRRLALLLAPLVLAACTHSTPVAKAVAQPSPYGVVMVATLAPGSSLDGTLMERLARMPGVGATGGRPGTFRVVVRAHATVEQYLAARRALAAVPGVARIATTTSTGTSLDR
jgi:hypothetical protein